MKKHKIIIMIFFIILAILLIKNDSNAAYISNDINNIDEDEYPGYKNALLRLKNEYPNWDIKLLYTGLDWNYVIEHERTGHGNVPKSLIYDTFDESWRCQEEECIDRKYDVSGRWYCASRRAIEYMMDPRTSLDDSYIFQFQNLSSSLGERNEINKMVEETFLDEESGACVDAILYAAHRYDISPFHLVSRIIQEQGPAGSGRMNGYVYKKSVVYNLFNIKVSGNTDAGLLNGAAYAYDQEWFSKEASIVGGAEFIKENYFSTGQTTLYFQKYNVVDSTNLFNHQYMQNIRGANDEGYKISKSYKSNGIINSHFEFIIPIYNNMPNSPCSRPRYIQISDIKFEKQKYIIYIDDAVDISYELTPSNCDESQIDWSSSDPDILRVWHNRFRGLKEGTAEVIAKTTDGRIEKRITVIIRDKNKNYVQNIQFEKEKYIINIDEAVDIPFEFSPQDSVNAEFEWSSSDPEILRVWHNRFRGLKEGSAYVIARTIDGTYEKKLKVIIRDPEKNYVEDIIYDKQEYTINIDEAVDIPFEFTPKDSVNAEFEWSSSNPDILRVWHNRFRGLKEGTAYVVVRTSDESIEKKIKVNIIDYSKVEIEKILLEKDEYTVNIDDAIDISFGYEPSYAQKNTLEWSSSNPEILRVWHNRFRGLKEGTAYVIVKTDDERIERRIKVIVKDPDKVYVEDVECEKEEYITDIDEAVNLQYTVLPENSINAEFEWSSSDPDILRVSGNRYRGLKEGTAYVIVRTKDNMFEKRIRVTVENLNKPYVEKVQTDKEKYTIDIDEAVDLDYSYMPTNSKNAEFIWSSSNPEILRVWNNRFRGLKEGIAEVIVKTLDGRYEKRIEVIVNDPNKVYVEDIQFDKEEYRIEEDEAIDLPYKILPENSTNTELEWSSSNPGILRVWNNRFRGLKQGTAYVIVKTLDGRFEKKIKVTIKHSTPIYVEDIQFEQEEYTIVEDEAVDLPYTVLPENSVNAEFEWSSSDPDILRVWNNRFRGLKQGTAYVIVKTLDGRFEKRLKVVIE